MATKRDCQAIHITTQVNEDKENGLHDSSLVVHPEVNIHLGITQTLV